MYTDRLSTRRSPSVLTGSESTSQLTKPISPVGMTLDFPAQPFKELHQLVSAALYHSVNEVPTIQGHLHFPHGCKRSRSCWSYSFRSRAPLLDQTSYDSLPLLGVMWASNRENTVFVRYVHCSRRLARSEAATAPRRCSTTFSA